MKKYIQETFLTIISLLRILRYFRKPDKYRQLDFGHKMCFVMGNGPSLEDDFSRNCNLQQLTDVWCVNRFADTELYRKIRPKHYVIADSQYWDNPVSDRISKIREDLFNAIYDRTDWKMTIYVPFEAKYFFERRFANSKYISVLIYNAVPVSGFRSISNKLYKFGFGMPLPQNVLIATLFLALRSGYKKIVLLGADHSWHQTLELDKDNRVCLREKHFYEEDSTLIPFYSDGEECRTFTMPQLFTALAKTFEGYWAINEYASFIGSEIINASSITYIDAFKRSQKLNTENSGACLVVGATAGGKN